MSVTRDLDWIKGQLQLAIELELATLPIYLSAMLSLEVQNYTAYNLIRSVVMEEMVHASIAANMLAAIGGAPKFAGLTFVYPTQGLPGGAEPDLQIGLARLSKPQLEKFMRLESPSSLLAEEDRGEDYPTIGAFYAAIRDALHTNADAVRAAYVGTRTANQVGDNIGFSTFDAGTTEDPLTLFDAAIAEILEQGEGCEGLFAGSGSEDEASHFLKFAEIYFEAGYADPDPAVPLTRATLPAFFGGRAIPWPQVVNTLAVPKDGYAALLALDPAGATVLADLQKFDGFFTSILTALDAAWNGPADKWWPTLGGAVDSMMKLRVFSCFTIMRCQVPSDLVARLAEIYPDEVERMRTLTDLGAPVFYGPRFFVTGGS